MNQQPFKWMKLTEDSVSLTVKTVPNSSKNSVSDEGEFLKIKITAPAVDNKANSAIIEYLSKIFKVPKTSIIIKSGKTSKLKTIVFPKTLSLDDVTKMFE